MVFIVSAFCIFVYFYPLLKVQARVFFVDDAQVEVDFDQLVSDSSEQNYFKQPLAQYSAALLAMNPQLDEVRCRMTLSGDVICEGKRKKPAALIALPDLYGLSSRGELIPFSDCDGASDLLVITGIRLDKSTPYTVMMSDDIRVALRVCITIKSDFPGLYGAISEIDMSSPEGPVLYMRYSDSRVIVGRGEYKSKLRRLGAIMAYGNLPSGAEIDLRFGRSVVAKRLT